MEKNEDDYSAREERYYCIFLFERMACFSLLAKWIAIWIDPSNKLLVGITSINATLLFLVSNSCYLFDYLEAVWKRRQKSGKDGNGTDKKEIEQEEGKLDADSDEENIPDKAEDEKDEEEIQKLEAKQWAEMAMDYKEKSEIMQAKYDEAEKEKGRLAQRLFDCERELKKTMNSLKLLQMKQNEKNEEDWHFWKEERSQLVAKLGDATALFEFYRDQLHDLAD